MSGTVLERKAENLCGGKWSGEASGYEIIHGTEMAGEKFHSYFLPKAKCVFKD